MSEYQTTPPALTESAMIRSLRRAELLAQRRRAATARRRRGYALRLPVSQPLILAGPTRPHLR